MSRPSRALAIRSFGQILGVRKREIEPALIFFLFWFFVIAAFQVLKQLKKGLFVEAFGAYVELYAKLANVVVALLAVVAFAALYNRLGTRRLIISLVLAFVGAQLVFMTIFAGGGNHPVTIWSFYLFGDLWSTVWVTTFWAYLTELTLPDQSKRLYGIIGAGGIVGGLVGGLVVWRFVRPLGASSLVLGCAGVTALIGLLAWRAEQLAARPGSPIGRRDTDRLRIQVPSGQVATALQGAKLVAQSRYLLAVVGMIFLYEVVSQILDYQYSTAAEGIRGTAATQAFFGKVTMVIGVAGVVTQLLVVSLVLRKLGMTAALLVLPVAMAIASGVYLAVPVLWSATLLTISDNAFSYSINQTARETLFVPTSVDVKYKARAFANMLVQRLGKAVAIVLALGLAIVPMRYLSLVAIAIAACWVFLAAYAGREFERLTRTE